MANKIYTVVKDGEELDKLKTLAAAKKLADEEGAEVYSDSKCVYQAVTGNPEQDAEVPVQAEAEAPVAAEPAVPVAPVADKPGKGVAHYRLKTLMNVRKKPGGEIVRTLSEGTVVEVAALENDWLHLTDGTFILYKGGEFAEKL